MGHQQMEIKNEQCLIKNWKLRSGDFPFGNQFSSKLIGV